MSTVAGRNVLKKIGGKKKKSHFTDTERVVKKFSPIKFLDQSQDWIQALSGSVKHTFTAHSACLMRTNYYYYKMGSKWLSLQGTTCWGRLEI